MPARRCALGARTLPIRPTTFEAALDATQKVPRHLLLGNGFSMAVSDRFSYSSLRARAIELQRSGVIKPVPCLESVVRIGEGFEEAMNRPENAEYASSLRRIFADTIAYVHPHRGELLTQSSIRSCARFLAKFARRPRGQRGRIFTTNYDALLYWVLSDRDQRDVLRHVYDGLYWPETFSSAELAKADVFNLHGAMHLFERNSTELDRGIVVEKERRAGDGPGSSLIDRVRTRVLAGEFPLFVSEGEPTEKAKRIGESAYLRAAGNQFQKVCRTEGATLFVIGHGLSEFDEHLVQAIGRGQISQVYYGWFENDGWAHRLAEKWDALRPSRYPLNVGSFCTRDIDIW